MYPVQTEAVCTLFKLEAFTFETQNYYYNIGADILLIGVQNMYYSIVEIRSSWLTVRGLARMSTVLHLLCVNLNSSAAETGVFFCLK